MQMGRIMLILEASDELAARFRAVVREHFAEHAVEIHGALDAFESALRRKEKQVALISLGHPLMPVEGVVGSAEGLLKGKGGGMRGEVSAARVVGALGMGCPVIVHTHDPQVLALMRWELWSAGVKRCAEVAPVGAEWVERRWREKVEEMFHQIERDRLDRWVKRCRRWVRLFEEGHVKASEFSYALHITLLHAYVSREEVAFAECLSLLSQEHLKELLTFSPPPLVPGEQNMFWLEVGCANDSQAAQAAFAGVHERMSKLLGKTKRV
jgi:hypothetical protein